MNEDDMARRLFRLIQRIDVARLPETTQMEVLQEASEYFCEYCHRPDPGMEADGAIIALAVYMLNRMGSEGAVRSGEGSISRMYADGVPAELRARLNGWRRVIL